MAPHRGVVQRHSKGRQPGGYAIINSLVTGLFSLPRCLITASSLWQYIWYIQVSASLGRRARAPRPSSGVTCHQAGSKTHK